MFVGSGFAALSLYDLGTSWSLVSSAVISTPIHLPAATLAACLPRFAWRRQAQAGGDGQRGEAEATVSTVSSEQLPAGETVETLGYAMTTIPPR